MSSGIENKEFGFGYEIYTLAQHFILLYKQSHLRCKNGKINKALGPLKILQLQFDGSKID